MREQTIPEENELLLEVETIGKPHIVKWFKNGQEVLPSNKIRMEKLGPDQFRLVIPSALKEDSGLYSIEIENDVGKAKCEAKQTVEPFPEFIRPLKDLEVDEGENAEFLCETNLRSLPKVIRWFKNENEIFANERIQIISEPLTGIFKLIIKSSIKEDIGKYKILLENTAGKAESCAQLNVRPLKKLEPPKIVKALLDQIVAEGEPLTFEIQILGDVDEIKWLKDEFPIGKDARIQLQKVDDQT